MKREKSTPVHPQYFNVIATAFVVAMLMQAGWVMMQFPLQAELVDFFPVSTADVLPITSLTESTVPETEVESVVADEQPFPPFDSSSETSSLSDVECDDQLISVLSSWTWEQHDAMWALIDAQGGADVSQLVPAIALLGQLPEGTTIDQVRKCMAH